MSPKSTPPVAAVPTSGPPRPPRLPAVAERILDNGLKVMAVRRAGVPRVEVRVRIPMGRASGAAGDGAVERVVSETLLSGTSRRSAVELAQDLQRLGAGLSATAGLEEISLGGSTLSATLVPYLELLGEVLSDAAFPAGEVGLARDRVTQEIVIARSQPATIAHEALMSRLYPGHPYGRGLPEPESVQSTQPRALKGFAAKRLRPAGATLVAVGDVRPERLLDQAAKALSGWTGDAGAKDLKPPAPLALGPVAVVDRPGAVQTNIRIAGPALRRTDPEYPALAVANMIYGGYFSSRLVNNIREDKGYTYSPRSTIEHRNAASFFGVFADVATEVTAPAVLEIGYELGRMATTPVEDGELQSAKRYLMGNLALAVQTQAGLAGYLSLLESVGLGVEYLRDFPIAVGQVTADEVAAVASRYLAPRGMVTVLVGDEARIRRPVEALVEVS